MTFNDTKSSYSQGMQSNNEKQPERCQRPVRLVHIDQSVNRLRQESYRTNRNQIDHIELTNRDRGWQQRRESRLIVSES